MAEEEKKGIRKFLKRIREIPGAVKGIPGTFRRKSKKQEAIVKGSPIPKKNGGNGGSTSNKRIEEIQGFLNSNPEYQGIEPLTVNVIMQKSGIKDIQIAANIVRFDRERKAAEIEKATRRNNERNQLQLPAPKNTHLPLVREPWRIREEVRKQQAQAKREKQRRTDFANSAFTIRDHTGWKLELGFAPSKRELAFRKWGVIPSIANRDGPVKSIRARIPGLPDKIDTIKRIGSNLSEGEINRLIELKEIEGEINRLDDLVTKEGLELDRNFTPDEYRRQFREENAKNSGQIKKGYFRTGFHDEFLERQGRKVWRLITNREDLVYKLKRLLTNQETEAVLNKYEVEFRRYRSANYENARKELASAKEDEKSWFQLRAKTLNAQEEKAREDAKLRAKRLEEQRQLEAEFAAQKKNDRAGENETLELGRDINKMREQFENHGKRKTGINNLIGRFETAQEKEKQNITLEEEKRKIAAARSKDDRRMKVIQRAQKLLQSQFKAIGKRKNTIQSLERKLAVAEDAQKKQRQEERRTRNERLVAEQNKAFADRIKPAENPKKRIVDERGNLSILLSDKLENLQAIRTYIARWEDAYRKQGKDPTTLKISSGEMDNLIEFYKNYKHTRNEISELDQKIRALAEEVKRNPQRNKELAGEFYRLSAERNRKIQEFRANHRPGIEGTLNKYAQLRFQGEMKAVEKVVHAEDMLEKHREARAQRVAEQIRRLKQAEMAHAHARA